MEPVGELWSSSGKDDLKEFKDIFKQLRHGIIIIAKQYQA